MIAIGSAGRHHIDLGQLWMRSSTHPPNQAPMAAMVMEMTLVAMAPRNPNRRATGVPHSKADAQIPALVVCSCPTVHLSPDHDLGRLRRNSPRR